ncbi:hypothetical protein BGZ80_007664 [Entomortierella chlamydospora]|uniref:Uncharacterized protein n=1 Tax=Entomortierella chlamydospora TaxID=101097 RepID=A0A9P6ME61_9FUNG|nr:hypothetical protein BGZ79_005144 [Entomortierella chlamydospora]KAF9994874.1 hypothetical protein BGZ80_007664 [Entomortierella chlamydospora]
MACAVTEVEGDALLSVGSIEKKKRSADEVGGFDGTDVDADIEGAAATGLLDVDADVDVDVNVDTDADADADVDVVGTNATDDVDNDADLREEDVGIDQDESPVRVLK